MKLKLLLLLPLLTGFFSYGQGLTIPQWKALENYNHIPDTLLYEAERVLWNTVSYPDCYKFIHNADTTRFIAFFITRADDPNYRTLTRFGGASKVEIRGKGNNYYGYVLWGMKHQGEWYFDKDDELLFYSENTASAKNDLLIRVLTWHKFFAKGKGFWKGNGGNMFGMMKKGNPYAKEFPGVPKLVAVSKTRVATLNRLAINEWAEEVACTYQDSLWNALHTAHPVNYTRRFKGKFKDSYCTILHNTDGSAILMPLLYYNDQGEAWLQYFYLKRENSRNMLYKWNKFEHRKVNRPEGDESLEVIYDIRTIIPNWGWGTQNVISTVGFWENNFTEADLIPVE